MVNITVKAALALVMVLAFLSPALAGVVGKFTSVEGRVDVLKPGQKRAAPVGAGAPVSEGDIVRTKSGAFAEITFTDDTVLRLTQSTRIEITEYLLNGNKRTNGALKLLRGKVRATVSKGLGRVIPVIYSGPATFKIQTPTAVAGVKGTDFFVTYSMGSTGVFVLEGAVDTMGLGAPEHVVRVRGGEYSIVERNMPATSAASTRDFVITKHLRDAQPGAREKREHRDRKEHVEDGSVSRVSERREREESRRYSDDDRSEREFREDLDRDERDFNDFENQSGQERDWDEGSYEADRYEHDYHHENDYDRPITEVNTALLNSYFKGAMASAIGSGVNISAQTEGKFKDDFTWWADIDGAFNNASGSSFTGSFSGTTSEGSFTGTLTNGSWQSGTWSADVSGTLPGGTFTGTLSGRHDAGSSGELDGAGSGTWTTGSPTVN